MRRGTSSDRLLAEPAPDSDTGLSSARSALATDLARQFDLEAPPLLRVKAIVGEDRSWLTWSNEHIVIDGWSRSIIMNEMWRAYARGLRGGSPGADFAPPFSSYIAWLQERDLEAAGRFWKDRLDGAAWQRRPYCRFDRASPESFGVERLELSPPASSRVRLFAQRERITLNTIIQGAWALLIAARERTDDVVYGTVVSATLCAGRRRCDRGAAFVNLVPVRVRTDAPQAR